MCGCTRWIRTRHERNPGVDGVPDPRAARADGRCRRGSRGAAGLSRVEVEMRAMDVVMVLGMALAAFFAGVTFNADRIKATCESDDRPLVIQGTQFVCLSPRHVEMLQRQQNRSNWKQS